MWLKSSTAVLLATVLLLSATPAGARAAEGCDFSGWQTECSVSNSGSQVDVGASISDPATPVGDSGSSAPDPAPPPPPVTNTCTSVGTCGGHTVVLPPDVSAEDLASFRPAAPSLTGQPTGFGIVGAPTNLVAAASEQYLSGPLLGWDVTVRFVPSSYVFEYGDGASGRSSTGGASWEALGQAQFTPTATSHAYRERGTYPVRVSVQYTAAVDFGSGIWRRVTGLVTATSGTYDVQVVEARTALVGRTCAENPGGPGC